MDAGGERTETDPTSEQVPTHTSRRRFLKATGVGSAWILTGGAGSGVWTEQIVSSSEDRFPPPGEFSVVGGTRLHYVSEGSGEPVVLIHGDGGSIFDWTFSALADVAVDFQAIAVDRPGFGYSNLPSVLGSPFVQARLLRDLLSELDVFRPILVGHSRGASVALAYASLFPEDLGGIVDLAGQPYQQDSSPLHFRFLTWPLLGLVLSETVYVPFSAGQIEAGIRAAFEPEGTPPEEYLEAYIAMERRPAQLRAHAYDSLKATEMHARLSSQYSDLECPVAVVHGTADENVPFEQATRLANSVPRSKLFEVTGAGHELAFYHPDILIEAIDWVGSFRPP